MRLLVFICLFFTLTTVTLGQDKPPVAVDDTVYFPIAYQPYENYFYIYPLSNDYSQEMHPIIIGSCSYVGAGVAIVTDTTISLFWFQLDEDIVFVIEEPTLSVDTLINRGDADFVDNARTDVEAAYPDHQQCGNPESNQSRVIVSA